MPEKPKPFIFFLALLLLLAALHRPVRSQEIDPWTTQVDPDYRHASAESVEAWKDFKFGLRIHWGIYSTLGVEASWPIAGAAPEFQQTYLTQYQLFNPTEFSADQWATDAERWGFKFFILTTKHHDGFCMYPTQTMMKAFRRKQGSRTSYNGRMPLVIETVPLHFDIMDTPFQRDIVGEVVGAFRKRGLGIGLYYSNVDWADPNFRWEPNNVHYRKGEPYGPQTHPEEWRAFIERQRRQVLELCRNYGPLNEISLDGSWPKEAWPELVQIIKEARKLQPGVLFRNRGIGLWGDFQTPEHWVPEGPADPRLVMKWEAIEQIHTDWAWTPQANYKPKEWILKTLIECTAMGGNFMVGVSPMPNGKFSPQTVERLEWAGRWLKVNGEAIYRTRPITTAGPSAAHDAQAGQALEAAYAADLANNLHLTQTKDGRHAYAIVIGWPGDSLKVRTLRARPGSAVRLLGTTEDLPWTQGPEGLVIELPERFRRPENRPCEYAWVFKIETQPLKR